MNLETVRHHCEHQIDMRLGRERIWTSDQMLEVVTDLQRLLENQRTDPHILSQMRRMNEELTALYAENQRLMQGKLWTTYRMEDGSSIYGEYAFVTEPEFFEDTDDECRVVKETWRLVASEVIVFNEYVDEDEDDDLPPGATVTVLHPSDLLSGGPSLGDSVRRHPASGPEDSRQDAPDHVERPPDLP